MRTLTLALIVMSVSSLSPARASDSPDQSKKPEQGSSSGPLAPVREAVKGLERAIAEEPPKAIRNLKEAFDKRVNRNQDSSGKPK